MPVSRRSFVTGTGVALLGAAVPLSRLFGRSRGGAPGRYGPLVRDPNGVLDLPRGFSYRVLERAGDRMTDGFVVPGAFDGMACFPGKEPGTLVLMRNHENTWFTPTGPYRKGAPVPAEAYDAAAQGGVTRLVLSAKTCELLRSNLVLTGTVRNCAGGPSPWGFLSCEETTEPRHGYVFLCPLDAERVTKPRRLDAYGRFRHEAACVDPETSIAYLTEDEDDGCFYRMVPDDPSDPFTGRLQAMAVVDRVRFDTSTDLAVGQEVSVHWVDVDDPVPGAGTPPVRRQAAVRGAARVKRGEGIWFDRGRVFFSSTTGGPRAAGQIFRLTVGKNPDSERLLLLAQSSDTDVLDMPDNLTVAPTGDVFLAEDSVGGTQHVRIVSERGDVGDFARNALSRSELAGVCFAPDGDTLFLNIYGDGLTLAVKGPFR